MNDIPSGGSGGQMEQLVLGFAVEGGEQTIATSDKVAKSIENVATQNVKTVQSFSELKTSLENVQASIDAVRGKTDQLTAAQQAKYQADKEMAAILGQQVDQGTRYLAKLEEMVKTFNMTTAELQRFEAAQAGVRGEAEKYIVAMEQMAAATELYGVAVKNVEQIEKERALWEEANMTALNAQRVRSLAEQAASEESSMTALNAQRVRALTDQALLEESANTSLNAQRKRALADQVALEESASTALNAQRKRALAEQAEIEESAATALEAQRRRALADQAAMEESARTALNAQRIRETTAAAKAAEEAELAAQVEMERNQTIFNAFKIRTMDENRAEAMRILTQQEQEAVALAEKQAVEEIKWAETSLKQKVAILQRLAQYQANPNISSSTTEKTFGSAAISDLGNLEKYTQDLKELESAHNKVSGAAKAGAAATKTLADAFDNNRVRTEAITLAHEALQGRTNKLAGSFMVFGEYLQAAGIPLGGFAGAAVVTVGVIAALAYEMEKGQAQTKAFGDAIIRTNDVSGETVGRLEALAQSVGKVNGQYTEAYKAAAELTASGKFTADQIDMITKSAVDMSHVFGQDVNTTIKEFETLVVRSTASGANGIYEVAKAVEKLDEQYHFLTVSQMQSILQLEKEGDARAASALAIKLYAEATEKQTKDAEQNIGWIELAWNKVTAAIKGVGQALADVGKKNTQQQDEQTLINKLQKNKDGSIYTDTSHMSVTNKMLLDQYYTLESQISQTNADSNKAAEDETKALEAKHALMSRAIEDVHLMKKSQTDLQDALDRNAKEKAVIVANDPHYLDDPKNVQYEAERVQDIIKAHTQKVSQIKNDGRKQDLLNQLNADDQAYQQAQEANDTAINLAKKQADAGKISRQQELDDVTTAYNAELAALTTAEDAKITTLNKYQALNKTDAAETKKRIDDTVREYQLSTQQIKDTLKEQQEAIVDKAVKQVSTTDNKELNNLDSKIRSQQKFNAEVGKTADQKKLADAALDAEILKSDKLEAAYQHSKADNESLGEIERATAAQRAKDLDLAIAKREQYNQLLKDGAVAAEGAAAEKTVSDYLDPTKVQNFGNALKDAFSGGNKALVELIKTFEQYSTAQAKNDQARDANDKALKDKTIDQEKYDQQLDAINQQRSKNQIAGYANMANAAASFFDKHSKGYQVLNTVSEVFHAAELAHEMALMVPKAINAILSQGEGDPYTAFTRMAAMTALVAGLGVAVRGGGGGPTSSADQQKLQGTGSVLGDTSAKSNSLNKAIELTAANTSTQINYLSSMNMALQSIQTNITSFSAGLAQSGALNPNATASNSSLYNALNGKGGSLLGSAAGAGVGFAAGAGLTAFTALASLGGPIGMVIGGIAGKYLGSALSSIFGGKQSVDDTGVTMSKATLSSILSGGADAKSYANITTSGGWFSSDSHSTQTSSLGADVNQQFTAIISSMANSVTEAGKLLGVSGKGFTNKLDSFVVDIGNISLKGLSAADQQSALEAVFSKLGDQLAQTAIPDLTKFQQVGEGYLQTLVRVASDYAKVDASLQSISMTFGSVGIASISARENLIALTGGIDNFQSKTADFAKNFLTVAQQQEPVKNYVEGQLNAMGLGWVQTREQFASVVQSLNLTTSSGQKTYAALMNLEGAFASVTATVVDNTKSFQDIANERKDLQTQLDNLTLTNVQLLQKQRDAIDDSNKALFDQVQAIQSMKDAATALTGNVDSAFSVLQDVVNAQKTALSKAHDAQDKLFTTQITNQQTLLTTAQGLSSAFSQALSGLAAPDTTGALWQGAKQQIQEALKNAQASGNLPTVGNIQGSLTTIGQGPQQNNYKSELDYLRDLYSARNTVSRLNNAAGTEESVQQKMLDTLNAQKTAADDAYTAQTNALDDIVTNAQSQVDILKGQSTSLLSIDDAMHALLNAIGAANANPLISGTQQINTAYQKYLGRAPDAAGLAYYQQQITNGGSINDIVKSIQTSSEASSDIENLYETLLNRHADQAGLQYYLNSGGTLDDIRASIMQSAEYKGLHSFDVGTNYVPRNMLAMLHEGEAVIPKADNSALRSAVSNTNNMNSAILAELQANRQEMAAFRKENKAGMVAMQRDTSITAQKIRRWDGDGMPETRNIAQGVQ